MKTPSEDDLLRISPRLMIPRSEFVWTFSRSSGPGGQNVNKVNSKATLHWPVMQSSALPEGVRNRFVAAFGTRLTHEGVLVIASDEYRDQPRNIEACEQRLAAMIAGVEIPPKVRRPTKPSKGSQQRRIDDKKRRSTTLRNRRSQEG